MSDELRDKLRELGYDARLVNGDCFDIHQDGLVHYLTTDEAQALFAAGAGIDLSRHCERRGLNWWYTFPAKEVK